MFTDEAAEEEAPVAEVEDADPDPVVVEESVVEPLVPVVDIVELLESSRINSNSSSASLKQAIGSSL